MPNYNPKGGKKFVKGQVANPLGGGAHNQDVKQLRKLTADELEQVISLVVHGKLDELQAIARDKDANVLKIWIASIAVKAIQKGDPTALNALLDRVIGKVKDRVHFSGNANPESNVQIVVSLPKNGSEEV